MTYTAPRPDAQPPRGLPWPLRLILLPVRLLQAVARLGCGCSLLLLALVAILSAGPYVLRMYLQPVSPDSRFICREMRLVSDYMESMEMAAPYYFIDRRQPAAWVALEAFDGRTAWMEFQLVDQSLFVAAAEQVAKQPVVVQRLLFPLLSLAANPRLPLVPFFSPLFRDCPPAATETLAAAFARDVLGAPPSLSAGDTTSTAEPTASEPQDPTAAADAKAVLLGIVTSEQGANVRSGPGLEHSIVTTVPFGYTVAYVNVSEDGQWLQLQNGHWIFADLVNSQDTLLEPSGESTSAAAPAPAPTLPTPPAGSAPAAPDGAGRLPSADSELRAILRLQALTHVNHARAKEGLKPVFLGDNAAAQSHAEEMRAHRYLSHWNLGGLTPDMRYTKAGGQGYSVENVAIHGNRITDDCVAYDPADWLQELLDGLMTSPGHRANILTPSHNTLHLGLAMDCGVLTLVQQFAGEYVAYSQSPALEDGILTLEGEFRGGALPPPEGHAGLMHASFLPAPSALTRGQLFRAGSYCPGPPVLAVLAPPPSGFSYSLEGISSSYTACRTPYHADPESPEPQSPVEALTLHQQAQDYEPPTQEVSVQPVVASQWLVSGSRFVLQVDMSTLLAVLGPGVYSLTLWGEVDGELAPVSEYSLFLE